MNELELLMKYAKNSLIQDQRSGVKVNGQKMTKEQALDAFIRLESHFGLMGSLSLGICKDCKNWTLKNHYSMSDSIGTCILKKIESCSCYSSCYNFKRR